MEEAPPVDAAADADAVAGADDVAAGALLAGAVDDVLLLE